MDDTINNVSEIYKFHRLELLRNIQELENIAKEMKNTTKNVAIAQTTGSSAGIVAGAVGLTGFILVPFTFGASLVLGFVGIGLGAAGAATHIGSGVTGSVIFNKRVERAEAISKEIQRSLTKIEEVLRALGDLVRSHVPSLSLKKDSLFQLDDRQLQRLRKLKEFIPLIKSSLKLGSMESANVATKTTTSVLKYSPKLVGKVVGGAVFVVGMAFDIADIVNNAKKFRESYQPEAGIQICERVQYLKNYLEDLDHLFGEL